MQTKRIAWAWLGMCVSLVLLGQAHAQASGALRIRQATLSPDGATRLVVSVPPSSKTYGASDFAVTESGSSTGTLTVTPLSQSNDPRVSVSLVFDTSGSAAPSTGTVSPTTRTSSTTLASRTKAAAKQFIALLPPQIRVELVAFSSRAWVAKGFTTDHAALARAIDSLRPSGETALYDAVVLGAQELQRQDGAQHNLVVFTDGKDSASSAKLSSAVTWVRKVKATVTGVILKTVDSDASALETLASATGGRTLSASNAGGLAEAFGQAAADISSQYVITYHAASKGSHELDLAVSLGGASDHVVLLNPRTVVAPVAPQVKELPVDSNAPPVPFFASGIGFFIALGAIFLAVALFLGVLLVRPPTVEGARLLKKLRGAKKSKQTGDDMRTGIAAALGVAADVLEFVPKGKAKEEKLKRDLERSGWPLRSSEFRAIQVAAAFGGAIVGFVLFQVWWLGVLMLVGGALLPKLLLARKGGKRTSEFVGQLPETLDLLAGSLQAGYGFMQGLDTLVTEAQSPTREEFSRVITEARLGMPVEDSMDQLANRIDSDDFRWVVLAINIQRQVGGNLAALLRTVAETLRSRENVRRQIKVLSAEGRLSAGILTALPFGLAGYIMLVNPGYINALFKETLGRIMVGGALVMMGVGTLWLKKLIRIEV